MRAMLAVELVPTTDDAFYKANEPGIPEQLWSGALLKNTLARTNTNKGRSLTDTI